MHGRRIPFRGISIGDLARHRNSITLGIHALNVTNVVTLLRNVTGTASRAGSDQAARQEPGTRTNRSTLTASDGGTRRCAQCRADNGTPHTASGRGLIWGHPADLLIRKLSAHGVIAAKLIEAFAGAR
ncbi:MAG TPA: hypothetical protein VLU73_15295 [Methylococcaceae bacterium]|jgi:hypothetical protein|nr:hypothetical protein [Methylococcaceae bacterium]